jgi:hypothetical protein
VACRRDVWPPYDGMDDESLIEYGAALENERIAIKAARSQVASELEAERPKTTKVSG